MVRTVRQVVESGPPRWSTLELSGTEWRYHDRLLAAFNRTVLGGTTIAATAENSCEPERESSAPWRLWLSGLHRARAEFALGAETLTVVVDKDEWWSWSPSLGYRTGGTNFRVGLGPGMVLVAARRLLPVLEQFRTFGLLQVAGRGGVVVEATAMDLEAAAPQDLDEDRGFGLPAVSVGSLVSELGEGAERYLLVIDEALGILLRSEARAQGEAFQVCEVSALEINRPIDPGLLRLHPPDGATFTMMKP